MIAALFLAQALSPQSFYDRALARMASLPAPRIAMYNVTVRSQGAQFYVSRDADGRVEFGFSVGSAIGDTNDTWPVMVLPEDAVTRVKLSDGFALSSWPVLNATWNGVAAWMRYGPQSDVAPATPLPQPLPQASGAPSVIETVRSLGRSFYDVAYVGAGACPSGEAARQFHLTPRDRSQEHPATDVTIEESSFFICRIRFELQPNSFVEPRGHIDLYLKRYGVYPFVDQSFIDFQTRRAFGNNHIVIATVYRDVTLSQ